MLHGTVAPLLGPLHTGPCIYEALSTYTLNSAPTKLSLVLDGLGTTLLVELPDAFKLTRHGSPGTNDEISCSLL